MHHIDTAPCIIICHCILAVCHMNVMNIIQLSWGFVDAMVTDMAAHNSYCLEGSFQYGLEKRIYMTVKIILTFRISKHLSTTTLLYKCVWETNILETTLVGESRQKFICPPIPHSISYLNIGLTTTTMIGDTAPTIREKQEQSPKPIFLIPVGNSSHV